MSVHSLSLRWMFLSDTGRHWPTWGCQNEQMMWGSGESETIKTGRGMGENKGATKEDQPDIWTLTHSTLTASKKHIAISIGDDLEHVSD